MPKKEKMTKKIRKGDNVIVLTGTDKGKTGDVLRVFPKEQRVIVQGTNLVIRHNQPSANNPGGIDEKEAPIHVSNVAIVDPETGKSTKIGFKMLEDKRKVRIARRSGEMID